jgi:hypothetical protein
VAAAARTSSAAIAPAAVFTRRDLVERWPRHSENLELGIAAGRAAAAAAGRAAAAAAVAAEDLELGCGEGLELGDRAGGCGGHGELGIAPAAVFTRRDLVSGGRSTRTSSSAVAPAAAT